MEEVIMKIYQDEENKGLWKFIVVSALVSLAVFFGFTAISRDWSKDSFIISSDVVAVSYLFFGWFFYISEKDLLDSVSHGFKSFFRMLTRREKVSYVEYLDNKKYAPAYVYAGFFIIALLFAALSLLLRII